MDIQHSQFYLLATRSSWGSKREAYRKERIRRPMHLMESGDPHPDATYWSNRLQCAHKVCIYTVFDVSAERPDTYDQAGDPVLKDQAQDQGCYPSTEDAILNYPPQTAALPLDGILPTINTDVADRRHGLAGLATGCGYSLVPRNGHLVYYEEREKLLEQPHE